MKKLALFLVAVMIVGLTSCEKSDVTPAKKSDVIIIAGGGDKKNAGGWD